MSTFVFFRQDRYFSVTPRGHTSHDFPSIKSHIARFPANQITPRTISSQSNRTSHDFQPIKPNLARFPANQSTPRTISSQSKPHAPVYIRNKLQLQKSYQPPDPNLFSPCHRKQIIISSLSKHPCVALRYFVSHANDCISHHRYARAF